MTGLENFEIVTSVKRKRVKITCASSWTVDCGLWLFNAHAISALLEIRSEKFSPASSPTLL